MRQLVKAAGALVADLDQRDPESDEAGYARALLDYYVEAANRGDFLVARDGTVRRKPTARKRRVWHWKSSTARVHIVQAVEENGPMTTSQLAAHMSEHGLQRTRAAINYALNKLIREGVILRIDTAPYRYALK